VSISPDTLIFSGNALNRALHNELPEINIPIREIQSVSYEFGWFTEIVIVAYNRGEFRFRCYGAKSLVNEFNSYIRGL
jgi:hypothetical protein